MIDRDKLSWLLAIVGMLLSIVGGFFKWTGVAFLGLGFVFVGFMLLVWYANDLKSDVNSLRMTRALSG